MPSSLPINVSDLIRLHGVESSRVEFKASWNSGPTALQTLQTVCAFANDFQNLNGGYVVIGVAAPDGRAVLPPAGLDPAQLESIQRAIRGRCKTLRPEYQPVLSPEVVDERHILVIWAPGSETRPHQAPDSLDSGDYRYFIRIGSETVEAKGENLTLLMQLTARVPFDDRRALGIPVEKLRESRVREFLADVRSGLLSEPDAREVYRRMHIVDRVNGHEAPRNIGLLFFTDDPEEWFRGARIEVAQFAGDAGGNVIEERVFRGPLHQQIRDCLSYLRNLSTYQVEKAPDRPESSKWVSYPLPAYEEALVNAVYHRGYDGVPEPTKVYLYPDRMEVISYPGPVPGIAIEHLRAGGRIPPVAARNRRIGEYLKELRLAEARGTGIPRVFNAMAANGSPLPVFDFDEARSYFRVTLPAHPEYVAIAALRDAAHMRAIGDSAGAVARLQRAFDELPTSAALASELITELGRSNNIAAARGVFDRFVASGRLSGKAPVVTAMSSAYLLAGDMEGAYQVLDLLPERLSGSEAIEGAILEKRAGRFDRAHGFFEAVADEIMNDPKALQEFAQTKLELAREAKSKVIRRSDRRPLETENAVHRLRIEARDLLRRALQMPAPPLRHAWTWFDLGRTLKLLAAPKSDVRRAFEEAVRLAPTEKRFQEALERESHR